MKNNFTLYLRFLFCCCLVFCAQTTAMAQCIDYSNAGGPYVVFTVDDPDPECEEGTTKCAAFQAWGNEAYVFAPVAGSTYEWNFCNDCDGAPLYSSTAWAGADAEITVGYDTNGDLMIDDVVASGSGCSIEFTAPSSDQDIVIHVSVGGDCAGAELQTNNGFPRITVVTNPTGCGVCGDDACEVGEDYCSCSDDCPCDDVVFDFGFVMGDGTDFFVVDDPTASTLTVGPVFCSVLGVIDDPATIYLATAILGPACVGTAANPFNVSASAGNLVNAAGAVTTAESGAIVFLQVTQADIDAATGMFSITFEDGATGCSVDMPIDVSIFGDITTLAEDTCPVPTCELATTLSITAAGCNAGGGFDIEYTLDAGATGTYDVTTASGSSLESGVGAGVYTFNFPLGTQDTLIWTDVANPACTDSLFFGLAPTLCDDPCLTYDSVTGPYAVFTTEDPVVDCTEGAVKCAGVQVWANESYAFTPVVGATYEWNFCNDCDGNPVYDSEVWGGDANLAVGYDTNGDGVIDDVVATGTGCSIAFTATSDATDIIVHIAQPEGCGLAALQINNGFPTITTVTNPIGCAVCGDDNCDATEDYCTCPADCGCDDSAVDYVYIGLDSGGGLVGSDAFDDPDFAAGPLFCDGDFVDGVNSDPASILIGVGYFGIVCTDSMDYSASAGAVEDFAGATPDNLQSAIAYLLRLTQADIDGSGGTVTLTLTNPNDGGCQRTFDIDLSQFGAVASLAEDTCPAPITCDDPVISITGGDLTCTVTEVTLDGSGTTGADSFSWSDGTNEISTMSTVAVTAAGTYTLTATSGECSVSETFAVSLDDAAPNADAGNNRVLSCDNPDVTIDGSDSDTGTYSWTDEMGAVVSTDATWVATAPGVYTLTVTAANGCTGTDDVTVSGDIVEPDPGTCDDGDCSNGVETWDGCACVDGTAPVDPGTCDDGDCTNGVETWDGCECVDGTAPTPCTDDGICSNGDEVWDDVTCTCSQENVPTPCTDDGVCSNGDEVWDDTTCTCSQENVPTPCTDDGDCTNGDEVWDDTTCTCSQENVPTPCTDDGDCTNGFENWNTTTCSCDVTAAVFGCTNMTATNFDMDATCDDNSCTFDCPDPGTCDDNDCTNGVETWDGDACECVAGTAPVDPGCDDGNCLNGVEAWDGCGCVAGTAPVDPGCDDGDCSNGVETWDGCECVAGTAPTPCTDDGDCTNGFEAWNMMTCDCEVTAAVFGCTDMAATNFDMNATCDDNSCTFTCPDPGTCDDGDCTNGSETWDGNACECVAGTAPVDPGCDDGDCSNGVETWDGCDCVAGTAPTPCTDDGDCTNGFEAWNMMTCDCDVTAAVLGCTDMTATNFDMNATCDDNSCTFTCPDPGTCDDGDCTNGAESWDGTTCECVSGTAPTPCTDDGDCTNGFESWNTSTCSCDVTAAVFGCTNATATNFDMNATCDDNSCTFTCPDPGTCDDGDCTNGTETWDGDACACVDGTAPVDPGCDDGDCSNGVETWDGCDCVAGTAPTPCTDDGDCTNGIESWNMMTCDCEVTAAVFGCTDATATNFDMNATCDDNSCTFACPDPGCDDGDCTNGVETWDDVACACVAGTAPVDPGCDDGNCANGVETWDGCDCVAGTAPVDPGCDDGECLNGTETWDGCECQPGLPVDECDPACESFVTEGFAICGADKNSYNVLIVFEGGDPGSGGYTVVDNNTGVPQVNFGTNVSYGPFPDGSGFSFTIYPTLHPECSTLIVLGVVDCFTTAVELLSFDGTVEDRGNNLKWATASESDNDFFSLQRASDGQNFETIAKINGAGNSNQSNAYAFLDEEAPVGIAYYRLIQTDFDGVEEQTSQVVALERAPKGIENIEVSPIPAFDHINLSFYAQVEDQVTLSVFDITGKLMGQITDLSVNGAESLSVDVSAYPIGVYFIRLQADTTSETIRFVKE